MDEILKDFLNTQRAEGMQLAAESDLLDLACGDDQHYVASYSCKGLVRDGAGDVHEHDRFGVGIRFPDNYLRAVDPAEILTWLGPKEIWHPNVRYPFICIGDIAPGTTLVDLLHRCFEVVAFDNVSMREDDALNLPACAWARRNRDRFPIDRRPIKRQRAEARFEVTQVGS
jgi:hypothetical protein